MLFLSDIQLNDLKEALAHMHVTELKMLLEEMNISSQAFNKQELIEKLLCYIQTGTELPVRKIPSISRATPGKIYCIALDTYILYGAYKNDAKTRNFFKQTIGPHFHFTAYGIDWLREQWLNGTPPTYQKFADEWQAEYERTKKQKRPAKQEWAYIRFVQWYGKRFPDATKQEITHAWTNKRQEALKYVREALKNFSK